MSHKNNQAHRYSPLTTQIYCTYWFTFILIGFPLSCPILIILFSAIWLLGKRTAGVELRKITKVRRGSTKFGLNSDKNYKIMLNITEMAVCTTIFGENKTTSTSQCNRWWENFTWLEFGDILSVGCLSDERDSPLLPSAFPLCRASVTFFPPICSSSVAIAVSLFDISVIWLQQP